MHRTYNKFLVVFATFLIIGGVYVYFSNTLSISAAETSGLSSSNDTGAKTVSTTNDTISKDTAFLATLVSLNKIKIDTSFVTSNSFKSLVDNSVAGDTVVPGRQNPFAPVETTTFSSAVPPQTIVPQVKLP